MSLLDVVSRFGLAECSPMSFYGDIFRLGSGSIQKCGEPSTDMLKTNPIVYMKNDGSAHGHYRILFEDDFEKYLGKAQQYDFAITNGLTYFGRKMTLSKASKMYALFVDLDGQDDRTLNSLLYVSRNDKKWNLYPQPNYIVLSGHNVHLVYVFEKPISLYPNIKLQLKDFKYGLISKLWNPQLSTIKTPQYQGINQGIRIVGGKTKIAGVKVRVFATGQPKWTIEGLNSFIPEQYRIDLGQRYRPTQMSFDEAKSKYPEWVAALQDEKPHGYWCVNRNLYEWSKRKIYEHAQYHHRYFCLMLLAICGVKCSFYSEKKNPNPVTFEEVKKDAEEMREFLDYCNLEHPMTDADISSALECFDISYVLMPRETLERLTAIPMPPQKRNGRTQAEHLARIRALRDIDYPNGEWRNMNGAPTKEKLVHDFFRENPNTSNREAAKQLGISRQTVIKWRKTMQE